MKPTEVIYDYDPRNIPKEYLEAIGSVSAAYAHTESILHDLIGGLLGLDNIQTLALTTHLSFPQIENIIRSLAELEAPHLQALDELDELIDAVKDANDRRNKIIHSSYSINSNTGQVRRQTHKARGTIKGEFEEITVEEINLAAKLLYKSGMDLYLFMSTKGLISRLREKPLREPPKRGKKAREDRKNLPK